MHGRFAGIHRKYGPGPECHRHVYISGYAWEKELQGHDGAASYIFRRRSIRSHPDAIMGGWMRYQNKDINNDILISYGYGDGGGGPTREMLETSIRMGT